MIRAFLLTAHRPTLLCLLAAITIITGSYPSAASGNVEWYGAVKASISEDTIDSIKTRGIGTGEIILGEVVPDIGTWSWNTLIATAPIGTLPAERCRLAPSPTSFPTWNLTACC